MHAPGHIPEHPSWHASFGHTAGVAGHAHRHWGSDFTARAIAVRVLALIMMAISIGMACYAAWNFKRRGDMLV